MELLFNNGCAYFPYKQLKEQIDLAGKNIFFTEKEIQNSVKNKEGYYITGRVHESITKELFNLEDNPYIFVVSTNCKNKPMFCTINGYVVYY